jgi:hypothetical protein
MVRDFLMKKFPLDLSSAFNLTAALNLVSQK